MWFKLLYTIYLTIAFVFPVVLIAGPISIRHIMSLLVFVVCVRKKIHWNDYLTIYTIYLLFVAFSSFVTGCGFTFISTFFGTFFQDYVFCFATYILIKQYKGEKWLLYFFIVVGLLNSIVTIGQFFNLGFAERITSFLGVEFEEDLASRMERYDVMEGITLQGIVGSVRNGYFLSALAVLALYNKKGRITLLNIAVWLVVMIASLLAQERMGFFVAVLMSFVVFFMYLSKRMKNKTWLISVFFVLIVLAFVPFIIDMFKNSSLRFAEEISISSERGSLAKTGWDYFWDNPWGGFYKFLELGNNYPHNVFVNMFLMGGLFGGIAILFLFFKQLFVVIKYLWNLWIRHQLPFAAFWGLMFLAYTLNSLTHNSSIVLGTLDFFIFWTAFEALRERDAEKPPLTPPVE